MLDDTLPGVHVPDAPRPCPTPNMPCAPPRARRYADTSTWSGTTLCRMRGAPRPVRRHLARCSRPLATRHYPLATLATPPAVHSPRRMQVTMTALGGYVYAVGGDGHGLPGGSAERQNLRYDPTGNSWAFRASAPYDIGTSAVSLFGHMYVFGQGRIQRYDPVANSWAQMGFMPSGWEIPTGSHPPFHIVPLHAEPAERPSLVVRCVNTVTPTRPSHAELARAPPSGRPLWPSVAVLEHLIYFGCEGTPRLISYAPPADGNSQHAVWTPLASMACTRKQVTLALKKAF